MAVSLPFFSSFAQGDKMVALKRHPIERAMLFGRPRARNRPRPAARAVSSEVETGSREENATKQESRAPALIPSKPERL
jgi:hypothetical protein